MKRMLLALALTLTALNAIMPTMSVSAATRTRCFKETGFCVSGVLLDYWEKNGGLSVFGYPITEQRTEVVEGTWTGPVQWFERDRLEDHSNEGKGVLAGRLGAKLLEFQGRPWQRGPEMPRHADCTFVSQTGRNMCGKFRDYWQKNGGLARFGYPITDPAEEQVEGKTYWVQYFERRRMELHPENAGTQYEVLLGLLGRDILTAVGGVVVPSTPGDLSSAVQQPILEAAYSAVRANNPRVKLAVGLVDVVGEYAAAKAQPFGQRPIFVFLARRANKWQVVEATITPSASVLRERGIPEQLWAAGDTSNVIDLALNQLQDRRGTGLNAYVTRPRVAGSWARSSLNPGAAENRDRVSAFFKRENGTWRFVEAGSAYPEEQLRDMGVPQELWPYGEVVQGPTS